MIYQWTLFNKNVTRRGSVLGFSKQSINALKCSGVRQLHFEVFSAIQV